jgi:hypothetical protein
MSELEQYFDRTDTPAPGSPVGALMLRVLEKNPTMGFEEARAEARALFEKAAGRRQYRVPTVYSPEEQEQRRSALQSAFKKAA